MAGQLGRRLAVAEAGGPARMLRRWTAGELTETELAIVLLLPCLLFLGMFAFYPIVNAFWTSLHRLRLDQPQAGVPFVGLRNFTQVLRDAEAGHAIGVTLAYVVVTVAAQFALGLGIALVVNRTVRAKGVVRAVTLLPWTLAPALAGQMWRWLFNDSAGVINDLLHRAGLISRPVIWLGAPHLAFAAVATAASWGAASYMALILLAGLQSIPEELYEASSLDGASPLRAFFAVTLPLLQGAIMVALVLRTLGALQAFDIIFPMTGGGPGNATETFAFYVYENTFQFLNFGYGAALSVILLLLALGFAAMYYRALAPRD